MEAVRKREPAANLKPLLYVYPVLLTGIHLLRTGKITAKLVTLNESAKLPFVPDLIARKVAGSEHELLSDSEKDFHRHEFERWRAELEVAGTQSALSNTPNAQTDLNDLLVSLCLNPAITWD